MNWKTLGLGSAMAGMALVGCGGDGLVTDAGPTVPDGGAEQTHTYVIGMIEANQPEDQASAYGFDLDGMVGGGTATGCAAAGDYTDPYNPSNAGVDNQLLNALGALRGQLGTDGADGAIRDQIQAGKILLMLEVSGINSFSSDPAISVHALLGQMRPQGAGCTAHTAEPACTADSANMCAWTATGAGSCATTAVPTVSAECAAHSDMASCSSDMTHACNWSTANTACTGIAAGQTFALLTDLGTVTGSITNGRMDATAATLPLNLPVSGNSVALTLRSVHFGGVLSATGITNGEFGAQVNVDDIMMLGTTLGFPLTRALVDSLVMPDLMPSATDPATCDAISAGMGFTAISATVGN